MKHEETPPTPGEDHARVAAAKNSLVEYLTGGLLHGDVPAAVRVLLEKSPEALGVLYERLRGDDDLAAATADAACWETRDALEDYIACRGAAAERMPEVAAHLNSCAECREQLESAAAVARERGDEWLAFSRSLGAEAPGEALVLTRSMGWVWSRAGRGLVRLLGLEDVELNSAVGGLRLTAVPSFARSYGLPDDTKPPRSFYYDLPENVARLLVHVIPKYIVAEHKELWRCVVELEPGPDLRSLKVGLGNEQRASEGASVLMRDHRRAEFNIEPPTSPTYWLHLSWKTGEAATWRDEKVHLPLSYDPHAEKP